MNQKYEINTSENILVTSVWTKVQGLLRRLDHSRTPTLSLSPVFVIVDENGLIESEIFNQDCLEVSKFMTRFLRHDESVHREKREQKHLIM